jgi:WD40 repeat protein
MILSAAVFLATVGLAHAQDGDPLPKHAVARVGTTQFRHQGLDQLAFSPDGKTLFTSGTDQAIRSFDVATGKETHHFAYAEKFATFADGKRVVFFTREGQIRICDPATGKELASLKAHPLPDQVWIHSPVLPLPDGKTVITAQLPAGFTGIGNGFQYFFDPASGKEIRRIGDKSTIAAGANCLIPGGAISPDGSMLATSVINQPRVVVWDTAKGEILQSIKLPDYATDLAFSADGRMLATAQMRTGEVILWEAGTGKERAHLKPEAGGPGEIRWVTFAPKGNRLAAVADDGRIWVWDVAKMKVEHQLPGQPFTQNKPAFGPIFSPDGETLAAKFGNTIVLWDLKTGKALDTARSGHAQPVLDAFLTPDGKSAITRDKETIRFWDLATGKETRLLEEPTLQMGLSRDGKFLVTLGGKYNFGRINGVDGNYVRGGVYGGPLKIWDTQGKAKTREIDIGKTCRGVVFGPDVATVAVADWFNKVELYEVATGKFLQIWQESTRGELYFAPDGRSLGSIRIYIGVWLLKADKGTLVPFPADHSGNQLVWSPDGKTLGCWSKDGAFLLYDVATEQLQTRIDKLPPRYLAVKPVFLPDGKALVFHSGKELTIRDAAKGEEKLLLKGIAGPWVVFPDGKRLAGVLEDGTSIGVWDLATGKETLRLAGHRGKVACLTVSGGGQRLISGSEDCTAVVWDVKK